jgi:hypothetical protein
MPYSTDIGTYQTQNGRVMGLPSGKHVDVLIIDLGNVVQDDVHFLDSSGVSRVNYVDWYQFTDDPDVFGPGATYNGEYGWESYRCHATQCASIAADQSWGWAKESQIYSMDIRYVNRLGTYYFAQMVKNWQESKPVNPVTGTRNPTVINMSLAHSVTQPMPIRINHDDATGVGFVPGGMIYTSGIDYRGTYHPLSGINTASGIYEFLNTKGVNLRWDDAESIYGPSQTLGGSPNDDLLFNSVIPLDLSGHQLRTDYEELVSISGVHVFAAAGNYTQKCVPSGDQDFDNRLDIGFTGPANSIYHNLVKDLYYNRLPYPAQGDGIMTVGAVGCDKNQTIATFSNRGSAVDYYAPGENIKTFMGPYYKARDFVNSEILEYTASSYGDGTSFACPQVVGMVACYLSDGNYNKTSSEVKTWLDTNAMDELHPVYDESKADNLASIQAPASSNKFVHYPGLTVLAPSQTTSLGSNPKASEVYFPTESGLDVTHALYPKYGSSTGARAGTNLRNMLEWSTVSGEFHTYNNIVNIPSGLPSGVVDFALVDTDDDLLNTHRIRWGSVVNVENNNDLAYSKAGLYFKYTDEDNYYALELSATSGIVTYNAIEKRGGTEIVLDTHSRSLQRDSGSFPDFYGAFCSIEYNPADGRVGFRAFDRLFVTSTADYLYKDTLVDPLPSGFMGIFSSSQDGGSATRCGINSFDYLGISSVERFLFLDNPWVIGTNIPDVTTTPHPASTNYDAPSLPNVT